MAGGRRRILVIEDDRETAEQLVDSLATSGYQVDLAVDGNDGLSRGRSAEYAVMTIDRMLPGIDGIAEADEGVFLRPWAPDTRQSAFLRLAAGRKSHRLQPLHARRRRHLCRIYRSRLFDCARAASLSLRGSRYDLVGDGQWLQVASQQWPELRSQIAPEAPAGPDRSLREAHLADRQRRLEADSALDRADPLRPDSQEVFQLR
jgi:Response regulator receiver domain